MRISIRTIVTDQSIRRGVVAALAMLNAAVLPLVASMVAVVSASWAFGRTHNFQLALVLLLGVVVLLRWKLAVGIVVNVTLVLVAAVMLFWSPEPFAYLAYSGYLLLAGVVLYGLIFLFEARSGRAR